MNNQESNINPSLNPAQPEPGSSAPNTNLNKIGFTGIKDKAILMFKNILKKLKESKFTESRIYKNKMIFWPVTIMLSLVILTLIIGLIFGSRKSTSTSTKSPTPTPSSQNQNGQKNEVDGVLSPIDSALDKLRDQITTFDVRQSRLQAPVVNFDVKF